MSSISLPALNPWSAVLAIHLLCAVIWVGGMFFALFVVRPSIGMLEPAQRIAMINQVFRRFFRVVWHVMPIALLSGYAMLFGEYGGFAGATWNIHAMHGLGLIMAVVFLVIVLRPWPRFRAAVNPTRAAGVADTIRKLILLNLILGIVTIIVAAF